MRGGTYKRGKIWWFSVRVEGKRYYQSLRTTEKEIADVRAYEIRRKLAVDVNPLEKQNLTFAKLVERYLAHAGTEKSKRSLERDQGIFKKLLQEFGHMQLSRITRAGIEDFLRRESESGKVHVKSKERSGLAAASVNKEFNLLRAILYRAVHWDLLEKNPAKGIKLRKERQKDIRFLTDAEIQEILNKAPAPWKYLIVIFLETGMRVGELAERLRWKDIDEKRGIITVHGKGDKTRYVPITGRLKEVLKAMPREGEQVFPHTDWWVKNKVKQICVAAKLPDVSCHVFRHTYASKFLEEGGDLLTLQKLLGHESIKTTMRYTHLRPDWYARVTPKLKYQYSLK
jgi:site-specific recombinase XerD